MADRLQTIVLASDVQEDGGDREWIAAKIAELAANLEAGTLALFSCVGLIITLESRGYLASEAGKHLVMVMKHCAIGNSSDLDDFKWAAELIRALPQYFSEPELEAIREAYSEFAERYAEDCDSLSPDELRDEASRVGTVGDMLQVDTDALQETLRESADEIEKEQEHASRPDDGGEWRGSGNIEVCSDEELHSMFGTLES